MMGNTMTTKEKALIKTVIDDIEQGMRHAKAEIKRYDENDSWQWYIREGLSQLKALLGYLGYWKK